MAFHTFAFERLSSEPRAFNIYIMGTATRCVAPSPNDAGSCLELSIPADLRRELDDVSVLAPAHPYVFFGGMIQGMIHGGVQVKAWKAAAGR